MPINHIGLHTSDIDKLSDFYLAALGPLGYKPYLTLLDGAVRGYSGGCGPDFWLSSTTAPRAGASETEKGEPKDTGPLHIAFSARTRGQVRAFHQAALAAGAKCNGPPGVRPEYFATYYAAFVLDPEGRNIEAVCMAPGFWAEEWGWGVWAGLASVVGVGLGTLWHHWA